MTSFYLYNAEKDNYITDKKYTGKKQIVLTDSLAAEADRIINSAIMIGYERLKDRHLQDYKELFDRVELQLEYNSELDRLPTNQRLARIDEDHPDNGLMMLYYQFGRYLMISGSRPGGLPLNLQGIWCKDYDSAWGSKYTININTEMNYWPAETCNLSECHEPLFDLIKRMVTSGRETAEKMYGCKGFVAHHNTDIFGDTAPQDIYIPATYWVMGAAWLCTHIWEHYVFTGDNVFLRESYPIMKEAALFFTDFLIEEEGYLVTCPSVSPENTYILPSGVSGCVCAGASMDTQILRDLFNNCIKASRLLGNTDSDFALKLEELMNKFVPIQVGRHGQIMEWREDYEEAEPGHRHISQLYALYPSNQITVDQTPELAEAAKVTLRRRLASGGGHTGWSRAWIINMYARLWDEKSAYEHLIKILTKSTLNNLFDNHPPFQIDGNFGATAAMVEMLVQSDENRIVLLPALPKEWNTGSVKGICVRGGAELTLVWCDRSLKEVVLQPKRSFVTKLCYASQVKELNLIAGQMMIIKYE
jgi:alpha-L-fucosidase 2